MIQPNQPTPKPLPVRERHKPLMQAYRKAVAKRRRMEQFAVTDAHYLAYWRCCGFHNLPAIRKTRGHLL